MFSRFATHSLNACLHQQRYIDQASACAGKGAYATLLTYTQRLDLADITVALTSTSYLGMVGMVAYVRICSHPDMSFRHNWLAESGDERTL